MGIVGWAAFILTIALAIGAGLALLILIANDKTHRHCADEDGCWP